LDRLDQLLAPAYQIRDAPPGAEGVRQVVSMFRAASPDLRITIEDQVAEGDKVCSRSTMRGTHKGVIFGIPATHKTIMMSGLTMVTIVDNRLVESWVKNDLMGLMAQLGAGAPPR
jgi:predicted ester cyclase